MQGVDNAGMTARGVVCYAIHMIDTNNNGGEVIVKTKKPRTRWTGTNKKQRKEIMRALSLKKHASMTPEERHAHAIKMAGYRWHHNKAR